MRMSECHVNLASRLASTVAVKGGELWRGGSGGGTMPGPRKGRGHSGPQPRAVSACNVLRCLTTGKGDPESPVDTSWMSEALTVGPAQCLFPWGREQDPGRGSGEGSSVLEASGKLGLETPTPRTAKTLD